MASSPTSGTEAPSGDDQALKQFTCLYFGFASNLSPRTIQQRCPGSIYVGLAVLKGWRFVIGELGFGNIVQSSPEDEVWGSLSFLTGQHEAALDKSEEINWWHRKMRVKVRRTTGFKEDGKDGDAGSENEEGEEVEATTYIDVERTGEGNMSKEYIIWMRKAIDDGLKIGVPQSYVDQYLRKFLPEDETVGREDQVLMLRTIQMDKENLAHVPKDILGMTGRGS